MMTNCKEEQKDEIEALESIYPDSFKVLTDDPPSFCINIETTDAVEEDENVPSLSTELQFTYSTNYPEEAPFFEIMNSQGFTDDEHMYKVKDIVAEQIEENLGMVMIFTIVSAVQEFLNEARDQMIQNIKDDREKKEREAREAEERKCRGTPVTVATFLAWKTKFDEELKELEQKAQAEKKENKLSGKEIFLQMKNFSDDSELLEGESEAVEVDESLFNSLDDLELEEELVS